MKALRNFVPVILLIGLSYFNSTSALAAELLIKPYQASYKLYRSGIQVAKSSLALEQSGNFWRWRLSSRPRGVYKFFSDKKPYSETTFSRLDQQYQIHNILLADEGNDQPYESARFNWDSQQADIQRNGKRRIISLPDQVYDFRTMPLQIAQMIDRGIRRMEFDFYLKGEVLKSKIILGEETTLEIGGKQIKTSVYHQTIVGRKTSSKFFFGPNSNLLPLKIENINSKGKVSIMLLDQVIWL